MISPYLRDLRKKIGHDMVLMPAVTVLVWDDDGRLLLVLDKETGLWQTVGGGMDPDESPEDAARRETLEETNVEVELTGLRGAVGGPDYRIVYPNKDEVAYVSIVYDARITGGKVKPDGDETADAKWYAKPELAGLKLDDFTRELFRKLDLI